METFQVVLIPHDCTLPLQQLRVEDTRLSSLEKSQAIADAVQVANADDYRTSLLRRPSDTAGLAAAHSCQANKEHPNIRATRIAMACGCLSFRFYGNVVLWRRQSVGFSSDSAFLTVQDIEIPCCHTADLRKQILKELGLAGRVVPEWLLDAARENYRDKHVLEKLAHAMKEQPDQHNAHTEDEKSIGCEVESSRLFVAKSPLCYHCRRPASLLCNGCAGVYFCGPSCAKDGWSHSCQCSTWKLYTKRREHLYKLPLGSWCQELSSRPFQIGEKPYREFLQRQGLICGDETNPYSWWRTEVDGWCGGESSSAQSIDVTKRLSFRQGFAPLSSIPMETAVSPQDWERIPNAVVNDVGIRKISDWGVYYELRQIDLESPVSLLLTFPLTLYHAIYEYGAVPATVAKMLQRHLRVHIVGAEKELNFLDLFQETSFLLPKELSLELVFIVRPDMLPASVRSSEHQTKKGYLISHSSSLSIYLATGTYGAELDPDFDCGTGSPDMLVSFNAGLFAYESWRSVIEYLECHPSVVGVFTDYNEYSGVHCANLGCSRETLCINPFRQPLALPVYSMNLPQMSNCFIYVYNKQDLTD